MNNHFLKYVQRTDASQPVLLVFDGHKTHTEMIWSGDNNESFLVGHPSLEGSRKRMYRQGRRRMYRQSRRKTIPAMRYLMKMILRYAACVTSAPLQILTREASKLGTVWPSNVLPRKNGEVPNLFAVTANLFYCFLFISGFSTLKVFVILHCSWSLYDILIVKCMIICIFMYTEIVIYLVIKLHQTCFFWLLSNFHFPTKSTLIENVFLYTFRSNTTWAR